MKREEAMQILQLYKDELEQRIDEADAPDVKDVYRWQMDGFGMAIEALQAEPTHGRLIDADALKKYFFRPYSNEESYSNIDIARIIDNAPTVQADRPHGEWIPVTEQLPKIDETLRLCDQISDEVLGTDTYGNIRHVYLTNCGYLKPTFCTVEEGMSVDIVAWMPLPESYEEVSDGKD